MVASPRFELRSQDPESRMIDHYTTRLSKPENLLLFLNLSVRVRIRPSIAAFIPHGLSGHRFGKLA